MASGNPGLQDDSTNISVFVFDSSPQASPGGRDRRSLIPLARNALRKLRTLRHPDVLRFIDGCETDSTVYIVTEPVEPLTGRIGPEGEKPGSGDEWKVWGLCRLTSALKFINGSGASTHGNLRPSSIFITPSGEWRLGGFDVLSTMKDTSPVLYASGGLLPDSGRFASPEVRKSGWESLKDLDPAALDSWQLHLLIHILFNGPLPSVFMNELAPSLPSSRGSIPLALFPAHRRLGNPNARARLRVEAFYDLGMGNEGGGGQQGAGFFRSNRLVKLSEGLEGFALASEGDRAILIRTIKESAENLPSEFVQYKVLPALIQAFEFGPGGPAILPLILSLGTNLPQAEYTSSIIQPLVRMFSSPDRAMRMALLEGLPSYADKLDQRTVSDKIWPNLVTGFNDVVPIIRESTVKSILLVAPKLSDRQLNNDLLRYLAKAQTDTEAGIRTNTCILLGRLSKHLQPATSRKVLVPAFARALRDPFVHARIAGLMSLMATVDIYEKDDLAGRVIPAMSICLVDKEKIVRQQAFKAMDMFVKRTGELAATMPDTVLPPEDQQTVSSTTAVAAQKGQPGIAETAGGAAVALAGWAFTSLSSRLATSDLATPMLDRSASTPPANGARNSNSASMQSLGAPGIAAVRSSSQPELFTASASSTDPTRSHSHLGFGSSTPGSRNSSLDSASAAGMPGDWGGDLMDVQADEGDFDDFESAQPSAPPAPVSYPRFTVTKPKPQSNGAGRGSSMKLGSSSNSSRLGQSTSAASVLKEIEADNGTADWSFKDEDDGESGWTGTTAGSNNHASGAAESEGTATSAPTDPPSATAGKEKLAQMRAERLARLAAAKNKKSNPLGAKKL